MERTGPQGKSTEEATLAEAGADYLDEIPEWIDDEPSARSGPGWRDILPHWDALVADFHEVYGIALTPALLRSVSWPWFTRRAIGLLTRPATYMQQDLGRTTRIITIPSTRLGTALRPPNFNPENK